MRKENFSEAERALFSSAQEKSKNNDLTGAVEVLEMLVDGNPASAIFNATLANTYKQLAVFDKAEKHFKKAVQVSPESEIISLGLFHCLWDQGKSDEAVNELNRYMSLADSDDYREIEKELKEKGIIK